MTTQEQLLELERDTVFAQVWYGDEDCTREGMHARYLALADRAEELGLDLAAAEYRSWAGRYA